MYSSSLYFFSKLRIVPLSLADSLMHTELAYPV